MSNLTFGPWVWEFHAMQSPENQRHLENEIIGDGWLFRQTAREQLTILTGAPRNFIERVIKQIKSEVAISMGYNPFK